MNKPHANIYSAKNLPLPMGDLDPVRNHTLNSNMEH